MLHHTPFAGLSLASHTNPPPAPARRCGCQRSSHRIGIQGLIGTMRDRWRALVGESYFERLAILVSRSPVAGTYARWLTSIRIVGAAHVVWSWNPFIAIITQFPSTLASHL